MARPKVKPSDEIESLKAIAKQYTDLTDPRRIDQVVLSSLVPEIMSFIEGPRVLEMGCGDGTWTKAVIEKHGHSHIVDPVESPLAGCSTKYGSSVTVYNSLFEEFTSNIPFDSVLAFHVLERVMDPIQILSAARDWLQSKGSIHILVPYAESLHRRLAVSMRIQDHTWDLGSSDRSVGHRRVYTVDGLESDIRAANLVIARKGGLGCKLVPNAMMTGWPLDLIRSTMKLGQKLPIDYAAVLYYQCVRNDTLCL